MRTIDRIKLKLALAGLRLSRWTLDKWEKEKHPRGKQGRFASKDSGSVSTKSRENGKVRAKRQVNRKTGTIRLGKREYAHVVSELNTHLTDEERKKPVLYKAIGSYVYAFENHGFDNYRFIRKERIE